VGKFKEPIGLEALRSDRDLTFAERSLASDLVPLRYIGAQVSGSVLSDSISYAGGYFNGSSDGSNGVFTKWAHGNEAAARLFFHPFATTSVSALRQFGVGVGGSAGHQNGTISGFKTMGQTTFFKYSSSANRERPAQPPLSAGLLLCWSVRAARRIRDLLPGCSEQENYAAGAKRGLAGCRIGHAHGRKELLQAESARATPRSTRRDFGASERWNSHCATVNCASMANAFPLFANSASAAQSAKEQAIGVNWYLNRYIKLETDYEHTGFRMASSTVTPLHSENVLMNRIQLAF
jgi:phosphate-selective porin OprO/OprP